MWAESERMRVCERVDEWVCMGEFSIGKVGGAVSCGRASAHARGGPLPPVATPSRNLPRPRLLSEPLKVPGGLANACVRMRSSLHHPAWDPRRVRGDRATWAGARTLPREGSVPCAALQSSDQSSCVIVTRSLRRSVPVYRRLYP